MSHNVVVLNSADEATITRVGTSCAMASVGLHIANGMYGLTTYYM